MADDPQSHPDDALRQAGKLLAARQDAAPAPLAVGQRTAVQDATLSIVRDLRAGRSAAEIEQGLIGAGWQPGPAAGFIRLVSQLLARMYLVRTSISAGLTLITGMLASVLVPMARDAEFPWLTAGLVVFIAVVCGLATLRNVQLWRKFRAAHSP